MMTPPRMRFANLDEASLAKINEMEKQFKSVILAIEPYYPLATLNEVDLEKLRSLEKELGVILLAYRSD